MAKRALPTAFSATGLASGVENLNPPAITFWTLVREDLVTDGGNLLSQGFWALFWHSFRNWRMSVKARLLRGCLEHFGSTVLVPVSIGSDVTARQNTTMGIFSNRARAAHPVIGDHANIGAGAVIVGDITIGRGAIIGANAVVMKSMPHFAVVVGVPGRVIRHWYPTEIGDPPSGPAATS